MEEGSQFWHSQPSKLMDSQWDDLAETAEELCLLSRRPAGILFNPTGVNRMGSHDV